MSQHAIAAQVLKFLSGLRGDHRDHVMHIEIECKVKNQHIMILLDFQSA